MGPTAARRELLAATVARRGWWRSIGPVLAAQVGGRLALDAPLPQMVPVVFGLLLVAAGVARLDAAPLLRLARRVGAVPERADAAPRPPDA